ncbi:MAG: DUF1207 domain-containing protein [Planctomycetaceae bacterium]|nr:DUF1207 domain-containing protein [Planctomycetaceae bacterium]
MFPLRIALPVILWPVLVLCTDGILAAQLQEIGYFGSRSSYADIHQSATSTPELSPEFVAQNDEFYPTQSPLGIASLLNNEETSPFSLSLQETGINSSEENPILQTSLLQNAPAGDSWTFQRLPNGLMFKSYLAGEKEPRFTTVWADLDGHGNIWDATLGGRVGLLRWGTEDVVNPQGWQLDMEGAAMPRLDMESKNDLTSVDFRFGVPITYREGGTSYKFAYYHISSHVGDEFLENNPGYQRDNFVREALALAISHEPTDYTRVYAEVAYAFIDSGNAQPWEMQFGFEYSALASSGVYSSPFLAINWHIREELAYDGNITVQTGWQWRGIKSDHLWRMGVQYYNGATSQYARGLTHDRLVGFGMWFDY